MKSIIGNLSHTTTNKLDSPTGEDHYDLLFEVYDLLDENDAITNPETKDEDNDPPCVEDNDKMVNTKVLLQRNKIIEEGVVRSRKRDSK